MQKRFFYRLALLAVLAVMAPLHAENKIVSIEQGIEASTDTTVLPATTTGTVVLTCASCALRSYSVNDQTRYFVGESSVTLGELSKFVAGGRYFMMVFVKPRTLIVTRIVVSGHLSSRKNK